MSAAQASKRGLASKPMTLYPLKFEEIVRDVLTTSPRRRCKRKPRLKD
jgi:hypothetical protein